MAAEKNRKPACDPKRKRAIAELAEHIALEHSHGERVSPEEIAKEEGIAYKYAAFPEDFDGILLYDAGRFMVVCNERRGVRGTARSRFTFAHELGHYFIDEHRQDLINGKMKLHFSAAEFSSDQPIEEEADIFAANLLMPSTAFKRKMADHDQAGLSAVSSLSSVYGTSLTSTAYRAVQLDTLPAPAAVFQWSRNGTLSGRRLSPTTFDMFPGYRSMTEVIPKGSLTARAAEKCDLGASTGISDCSQWFPNIKSGQARNVILCEETMGIGQFGWLTLIYRRTE